MRCGPCTIACATYGRSRTVIFCCATAITFFEGDATLTLKPYLDFPGSLLWLEVDPGQHFLVTNSREPVTKAADSGEVSSPLTASATVTSDQDSAAEGDHPDLVVRILRRDSGEVMLVSRVRTAVHLPINSVGYLENLRSRGTEWELNLSYFSGGSRMLGRVESTCEPDDQFLTEQEILATGCGPSGESNLVAMTTAGRTLWKSQAPPTEVWPQLALAANGSRLAWETLDATHSIDAYAPMDAERREGAVRNHLRRRQRRHRPGLAGQSYPRRRRQRRHITLGPPRRTAQRRRYPGLRPSPGHAAASWRIWPIMEPRM
jgi:hypothetical protein